MLASRASLRPLLPFLIEEYLRENDPAIGYVIQRLGNEAILGAMGENWALVELLREPSVRARCRDKSTQTHMRNGRQASAAR